MRVTVRVMGNEEREGSAKEKKKSIKLNDTHPLMFHENECGSRCVYIDISGENLYGNNKDPNTQ